MSGEREKLAVCVHAATGWTPMIVRSVVNAAHSSKPLSWRRQQLDSAIRHVRSLLDELETQRIALGWRDRESDVVAPRTFGELCAAPSETVKLTEGLDEP